MPHVQGLEVYEKAHARIRVELLVANAGEKGRGLEDSRIRGFEDSRIRETQ